MAADAAAAMGGQRRTAATALLLEYWAALLQTPDIFRKGAFRKRSLEEELQEV